MDLENNVEGRSPEMTESPNPCSLSSCELDYLHEAEECGDKGLLIDRIDELNGDACPPKALDATDDMKEYIAGSGQEFPPEYLEAPSDFEQVEQASEALHNIEGADFETWSELSVDERAEVLQEIENKVADIAHRPACELSVRSLGEGYYGYFSPSTKEIVVNSDYLTGEYKDYHDCLDTIIHEGRHAYQDYNLNGREVHTSPGDLTNWRRNEDYIGYQDAQTCGFECYWMQPVEADARKFAEDVITKFEKA